MTTSTDSPANEPALKPARILLGCIGFVAVLSVTLFGIDRLMGHRNAGRQWDGLIGAEVYRVANDRSLRNDHTASTIYLGDSVALQMFWPGHESKPDTRYLTTNQAIGVAGQFYLLQNATAHFSNLRQVVLLYTPSSWANSLNPPLTGDYFCEFFHTPAEIAQMFRVKRDPQLTASQIGRLLLPNLMAANSESSLGLYADQRQALLHPKAAWRRTDPSQASAASRTEPVLRLAAQLSLSLSPLPLPSSSPAAEGCIDVSPLSAYFLQQIQNWCRDHRLVLRVIPCPCISTHVYAQVPTPYEAPLWYLPPSYFRDDIHFINEKVASVRMGFAERYGLERQ